MVSVSGTSRGLDHFTGQGQGVTQGRASPSRAQGYVLCPSRVEADGRSPEIGPSAESQPPTVPQAVPGDGRVHIGVLPVVWVRIEENLPPRAPLAVRVRVTVTVTVMVRRVVVTGDISGCCTVALREKEVEDMHLGCGWKSGVGVEDLHLGCG